MQHLFFSFHRIQRFFMAPSLPSNTVENILEELMFDAKRKGLVVHHGIIEKTICRSKNLPGPHITLNNICPDDGFFNCSLEVLSAAESEEFNPERVARLREGMGARKNQVSAAERELQKSEMQRELSGHKVDENDQQVYNEEEDDSIPVSELCKLTPKEDNFKPKSSKFELCSGAHSKQLLSTKFPNVFPLKVASKYNASFIHKSNIITSMGSSLNRVTRNKSLKMYDTKCDKTLVSEKTSRMTFTYKNCSFGNAENPIECDESTDDSTRSYPAGATVTNNMRSSRKTTSRQSLHSLRPTNGSIRRRGSIRCCTPIRTRSAARSRTAKTSAIFEPVSSFPSPVDEPITSKNISPINSVGGVSNLHHVPIPSFNKILRNGKVYDACLITTQDNMPKDKETVEQALGYQQNRAAKGCSSGLLTNSRQLSKKANTGTSDGVQVDARFSKHQSMQPLKSSIVDPFARRPQCSNIDIQCTIATSQSSLCQLSSNAILNSNSDYSQIQLTGLSKLKSVQTGAAESSRLLGNTVKNTSSNLTVSRQLRPRFQSKQFHLTLYKDGSHGIFPKLSSGRHWRPSDASVGSAHVCSMSHYRAVEPNFRTVDFLKCVEDFDDLGICSSGEVLLAPHLKTTVLPAEQVDVPNLSTIVEETVNLGTSIACKPGIVGVNKDTQTRHFSTCTSRDESYSNINKHSGHLLETFQISSKDDVNALCCKNNNESVVQGISSANNIISREAESPVVDVQNGQSITALRKSSSCDEFSSIKSTLQNLQESVDAILVNGDQEGNNNLYSMGLENNVEKHSSKCAQESNKHDEDGSKLLSGNNDSVTLASISSDDSSRKELAKQRRSLGFVRTTLSRSLSPTKPSNTQIEDDNYVTEEVLEDARSKKFNVCTPTINLNEFLSSKTASPKPIALTAPSSKIIPDQPIFVQSVLPEKISLQLLYKDGDKDNVSSLGACNTSKDSANKTIDSFSSFSRNGSSNQTNSFNNLTRKSLNLLGTESSDSDSDDGDSVFHSSVVSVRKKDHNLIGLQSLCKRLSLPERQFSSVKLIQSMLFDD